MSIQCAAPFATVAQPEAAIAAVLQVKTELLGELSDLIDKAEAGAGS